VVAGPARVGRLRLEAKARDIQIIDEHIDDPNGTVLTDVIVKPFGKQYRLMAVLALNKTAHQLPLQPESVIILAEEFSHSLDPKRTSGCWKTSECKRRITALSLTTLLLREKKFLRKSMRKLIIFLGLLFVVGNAAVAQSEVSDNPSKTGVIANRLNRIDDAINAEIAAGKIPGAVALVTRNGNVAYFKSFGFADVDSKVQMQNDNIFRIASMTKAITSVAAMTLYEQGHFQLNDPVAKYIPEFAEMAVVSTVDDDGNVSATVAATKPIRIIDLLTHTSGIGYPFLSSSVQKSYIDAGIIDGVTVKDSTLASQMKLLAKQPLMFEPGSNFAYGLSTDLLGYLIEVISGQSLQQFLAEEIFAP
jgi:hypothetical protein